MNVAESAQYSYPPTFDRKATLPRRILKIALRIASFKPGRYVLIVVVPPHGELQFEEATLQGDRQA